MEQKKPTKGQLEKMLKEASVYVAKANKKVHFSDIGVTIYDCPDEIVLMSNFHTQIWEKINAKGYSETCIMFSQLIDITLNHMSEIAKKDKKDNVYYTLSSLKSLKTLSENELAIIDLVEVFIYTSEGISYSLGFNDSSVLKLRTLYNVSMSVYNQIFDIAEKNENVDANTYWKGLISELRLGNLYINLNKEHIDEVVEFVKSTENEAYDKIKSFIESKGGSMKDIVAIHKQDTDEAEALSELQS